MTVVRLPGTAGNTRAPLPCDGLVLACPFNDVTTLLPWLEYHVRAANAHFWLYDDTADPVATRRALQRYIDRGQLVLFRYADARPVHGRRYNVFQQNCHGQRRFLNIVLDMLLFPAVAASLLGPDDAHVQRPYCWGATLDADEYFVPHRREDGGFDRLLDVFKGLEEHLCLSVRRHNFLRKDPAVQNADVCGVASYTDLMRCAIRRGPFPPNSHQPPHPKWSLNVMAGRAFVQKYQVNDGINASNVLLANMHLLLDYRSARGRAPPKLGPSPQRIPLLVTARDGIEAAKMLVWPAWKDSAMHTIPFKPGLVGVDKCGCGFICNQTDAEAKLKIHHYLAFPPPGMPDQNLKRALFLHLSAHKELTFRDTDAVDFISA